MAHASDIPVAMQALFFFHHLSEQVGAQVSARHPDMTPNEISLLLRLDTPLRMKDLANLLTCQPSNMTPLVARCEAKGWVRKTRSDSDARTILVELEPTGEALREALISEITTQVKTVSGLPDEFFQDVLQLLERYNTQD